MPETVESAALSEPKGALYRAARELADAGKHAEAITVARQIVRLQPEDAVAWCNLAALLQTSAAPAEALPAFREAVRLDPRMATAWLGLGCAHRSQGQPREAIAALQEAVRLDPSLAHAWYRLARLLEHEGEHAGAIRAYGQTVRLRPDHVVAWYSLAVLCREEDRLEEAASAFLEAVRQRPRHLDAWLGLGITYAKQGNRSGVLDVYAELAAIDRDAALAFAAEHVETWEPKPAAALPPARSARPERPEAGHGHPLAETWYAIGTQNRKRGAALEAISDFVEAVRFDPDHAKAWFNLAALYEAQGQSEEALRALREVVRLKPQLTVAWAQIGALRARRGDHEKASCAFRKVLQIKPDDVEAWRGLGRAYLAMGDARGPESVVEKLRSLDAEAAERFAEEVASARRYTGNEIPATAASVRRRGRAGRGRAAHVGATQSFDVWLRALRRPGARSKAVAAASLSAMPASVSAEQTALAG